MINEKEDEIGLYDTAIFALYITGIQSVQYLLIVNSNNKGNTSSSMKHL